MSHQLFRVVFDASLTGEFDEATSKRRFSRLFHLDEKRTETLFSGKDYVIKDNISEAEAMDFMIKVSETGCECYVQEVPDEDEPDYEEKRATGERRTRFRRSPRTGARVLDRRLQIRRKSDQKFFADLIRHIKEIPVAFRSYATGSKK